MDPIELEAREIELGWQWSKQARQAAELIDARRQRYEWAYVRTQAGKEK
jgi:hypothetical protein